MQLHIDLLTIFSNMLLINAYYKAYNLIFYPNENFANIFLDENSVHLLGIFLSIIYHDIYNIYIYIISKQNVSYTALKTKFLH